MTSRFQRDDRESRDPRFNGPPRDRSPPPPRFGDRRGSGPFGPGYGSRDGPRDGPGWQNNNQLGSRPHGGRFDGRPSGPPRGRGGFAPRPDFRDRDFRDGRASPTDRGHFERNDRPPMDRGDRFRDDNNDRWGDRRRSRTPPPRELLRDRNENRDVINRGPDIIDRPRRNSRDGPMNTHGIPHPPEGNRPGAHPHRGGFGPRISGGNRHDWEQKNRERFAENDDRDGPPRGGPRMRGNFHDGDRAGEPRDFGRREDPRDRRDDARWPQSEKQDAQSPMDTRFRPTANGGLNISNIHPDRAAQLAALTNDRPQSDDPKRESIGAPRDQGPGDHVSGREARVEPTEGVSSRPDVHMKEDDRNRPGRPDLLASRAESAKYTARASSPPPAPATVPAFGSQSAPWYTHRSNVWRRPTDPKTGSAPSVASSTETSPAGKAPPTAPRSQLPANPPTAPRAERLAERGSIESLNASIHSKTTPEIPQTSTMAPNGPAVELQTSPEIPAMQDMGNSTADNATNQAKQQHLAPPVPPIAPRAMTGGAPAFGRSPPLGHLTRDPSPAMNIPSGPRAANLPQTSPKFTPSFIPKGPRADRSSVGPTGRGPPIAPRAELMGRQSLPPPSMQWKPSQTPPKGPMQPSPRQEFGFDHEFHRRPSSSYSVSDMPVHKAQKTEGMEFARSRSKSKSPPPKQDLPEKQDATRPDEAADQVQPSKEDQDVPTVVTQPVDIVEAVTAPAPEDEVMDFTEEDFAMHEAKFQRELERLEARKIDLSAPQYCCTSILSRLSLLLQMRDHLPRVNFEPPPTITDTAQEASPAAIEDAESESEEIADEMEVDVVDSHSSRSESSALIEERHRDMTPPTPLLDPEDHYQSRFLDLRSLLMPGLLKREQNYNREQERLLGEYDAFYQPWKQHTQEMSNEHAVESIASQPTSPAANVSTPMNELPSLLLPTPTERGRAHRYSSQYDLDRALELSRREHEEAQEKVAEQASSTEPIDKEAVLPDMLAPDEIRRTLYKDVNQMRQCAQALQAYEFAPSEDTFTREEDKLMRELYNHHTKSWGKIASIMQERTGSVRTYKECISHYYATKWDKPFKKPQGRKGRTTRGGKRGGRGGRAGMVFATTENGADLDGDRPGESSDKQVTDSGRPRRAAAPKHFGEKEMQAENNLANAATVSAQTAQPTTNPTKPGQSAIKGEAGEEKAAKRRVPKEKGARKLKGGAARQNEMSPMKGDTIVVPRNTMAPIMGPGPEGQAEWLSGPNTAIAGQAMDLNIPPVQYSRAELMTTIPLQEIPQPSQLATTLVHHVERPRSYSQNMPVPVTQQNQRAGASSYWSVAENELFQECLMYFGTDFASIAAHMESKTQTMIKNKFDKYVSGGKHADLVAAARTADERRQRGEDMGPPPEPVSQAQQRKRMPAAPANASRVLAPSIDMADKLAAVRNQPQAPSSPSVAANLNQTLPQGSPPIAKAFHTPNSSFAQPRKSQVEVPLGFPQRASREDLEAAIENPNVLKAHGRQVSRGSSHAGSSTPRSIVADHQSRPQPVPEQVKNEHGPSEKPFATTQADYGSYVPIRPSEPQQTERPYMPRGQPLRAEPDFLARAARQPILAPSPSQAQASLQSSRDSQMLQPPPTQPQSRYQEPNRPYAEPVEQRPIVHRLSDHREQPSLFSTERFPPLERAHYQSASSAPSSQPSYAPSPYGDRLAPSQRTQYSQPPPGPLAPASQAPAAPEPRQQAPARRVDIMSMLNNEAEAAPARREPAPPTRPESNDPYSMQYAAGRSYPSSTQAHPSHAPPPALGPFANRPAAREPMSGRTSIVPSPAPTPAVANLASPRISHLHGPLASHHESRFGNATPPPSSMGHSRTSSISHVIPLQQPYSAGEHPYDRRPMPTSGSMLHHTHPQLSTSGRSTPPPPAMHMEDQRRMQDRYGPPSGLSHTRGPDAHIGSSQPPPLASANDRPSSYRRDFDIDRADQEVQRRRMERESRGRDYEQIGRPGDWRDREREQLDMQQQRMRQDGQPQQHQYSSMPQGPPSQQHTPQPSGQLLYPYAQHIAPQQQQGSSRPPTTVHEQGNRYSIQQQGYGGPHQQGPPMQGGPPQGHEMYGSHHHQPPVLQSRTSMDEDRMRRDPREPQWGDRRYTHGPGR